MLTVLREQCSKVITKFRPSPVAFFLLFPSLDLDMNGFEKVKIIASSGFGPDKCRVFASANAPINVIGTGSFLPQVWSETYATADIVAYDGQSRVKAGREFLMRK